MTRFLLYMIIILGLAHPGFASAQSKDKCTNPYPQSSPVWQAFDAYVKDQYINKAHANARRGGEYAYGHALGRLAIATEGNDEKREALACVEKALDQIAFSFMDGGNAYRRAQEAARGIHDQLVADRFHVTDISPLFVVFDNALRSVGRTSWRRNTPKPAPPKQPIIKPNTAAAFGVSSTAPSKSGINSNCIDGDRWSLAQAEGFLNSAHEMAKVIEGDCTFANFGFCQIVEDTLDKARDHIFQTVDQNHDGIAKCRLCNYSRAENLASKLVVWEKWLWDRHHNASGLGNIHQTIKDMSRDPLCRISSPATPVFPPAPVYDNTPVRNTPVAVYPPIGPLNVKNHVCADQDVPTQAKWKFYRYMYGGGARAYKEKNGLICLGRTTYRKISSSSWEDYKCDDKWENCRLVPESSKTITEVTSPYSGPGTTKYGHETGYGVRSPK